MVRGLLTPRTLDPVHGHATEIVFGPEPHAVSGAGCCLLFSLCCELSCLFCAKTTPMMERVLKKAHWVLKAKDFALGVTNEDNLAHE